MSAAEQGFDMGVHGEGGRLLRAPPESWLKRWLLCYRNFRGSEEDCEAGPQASSQRWIIMGFIIMLALTVMVLLLFWNYQCTFVDKLCSGEEESAMFPLFGDWDEESVKWKQV